MAVKARSVDLILSKDRKLGQEGWSQTTPTTTPSCASRIPHSQQCVGWPLEVHWKSAGSPQAIPQKPHKAKCTQLHHNGSTTPLTQELTSFLLWAEQQHLLTTTPFVAFLCPYCDVICLINCHGVTFSLLPSLDRGT